MTAAAARHGPHSVRASSHSAFLVPDWPAPRAVRALVTSRLLPGNSRPPYDAFNLGLRTGEDIDVVRANRAQLVRAFELPAEPRWLRQVHGTGVAYFDTADRAGETCGDAAETLADAAVTRARGIVLAILTADCLPLLLCARDGSEIAAIHAGWRGLAAGIVEACVGRLRAPPASLHAWLGPAIGPASYEVGDEVRMRFVDCSCAAATAFVATRPGHWSCDLYSLARQRLADLGIGSVAGGGYDTRTDDRFYSHRRDAAGSGRFASLIWINGAS